MLESIFTVYDEKAQAHLQPFFSHNSALAERIFMDCINNQDHRFSQHPSDYTLFLHGSFENTDASFTLQSAPKMLGNGVQYIQVPNNEQIKDEKPQRDDAPLRYNA